MSHITKTGVANIISVKAFKAAMEELGYTKFDTTIKAYDGKSIKVDVGVTNGKYGVGLVKAANGKYELIGDFQCFGWEVPPRFKIAMKNAGMSDQAIKDCILRYTTKHTIANQYRNQGYQCSFSEDKQGNIQINLNK